MENIISKKLILFNFLLLPMLMIASQTAILPILPDIKIEYKISLFEIGILGALPSILCTSGLFISFFKKYSMNRILMVCGLFTFIPCLIVLPPKIGTSSYNYYLFLLMRSVMSLSTGMVVPLIFTYVANYTETENRAKVSALIYVFLGIGALLGQSISSVISFFYMWQAAFWGIGIAGLSLIILMFFSNINSIYQNRDSSIFVNVSSPHKLNLPVKKFKFLNIIIYFQSLFESISIGTISFYAIFFFQEKGNSKAQSNILLISLGISLMVGTIIGGYVGDKLARKYFNLLFYLSGFFTAISIILLYLLFSPSKPSLVDFYFSVISCLLVCFPMANISNLIMRINPFNLYSLVFGIKNFMTSIGYCIGQLLGGTIITNSYANVMKFSLIYLLGSFMSLILIALMLSLKN